MLVWRGLGFLSLLIAIAAFAVGFALGGSPAPGALTQYLTAGALVIGAIGNWFLGAALNKPLKEAGIGAFRHHSLFFIPMQWWSIVMVLGAVLLALGRFAR